MKKEELRTAAPMPKDQEVIAKNSMKLYSYLVCLAGVANYPENTRMFRQKNLVLSQVAKITGISDKTTKLYMALLEHGYKIEYLGENKFNNKIIDEYLETCRDPMKQSKRKEVREKLVKHCIEIWSLRKKEKEAVYHIRRPHPYTPVPEETLMKLNKDFEASELEMKLYLLCCGYRDDCCYYGRKIKNITFEQIRDILELKQKNTTNKSIRQGLIFLSALGLLTFEEGYYANSKGGKIPCFKIFEVGYWIKYQPKNISGEDIETNEDMRAIKERIENKIGMIDCNKNL